MSERWIFVRHAQSEANVGGWLSGHVDVGLTDLGREQAAALARRLADERVVTLASSDLRRAADTARVGFAGRAFGLVQDPGLRERDVGAWSRTRWDALPPGGHERVFGSWEGRPPGGESSRDVARRVVPALARLEVRPGPRVVVAHGGVLRVILGLADGWSTDRIPHRPVRNAIPHARELPRGFWRALEVR
jgi:broad specificity phosphatase PhoE